MSSICSEFSNRYVLREVAPFNDFLCIIVFEMNLCLVYLNKNRNVTIEIYKLSYEVFCLLFILFVLSLKGQYVHQSNKQIESITDSH